MRGEHIQLSKIQCLEFLARVGEICNGFLYLTGIVTCVKSPSKQSDGDDGTVQDSGEFFSDCYPKLGNWLTKVV